ncbi:hypothetical protein [Streptomyces sp. CC224B]|uniref:hypothetical protein n=1 Tax=Streptomyces sp. CC224B TaxID=3044571 RepID=UPI0024A91996|nr:hypothetical protein [Streptomyces sp. CC224B]
MTDMMTEWQTTHRQQEEGALALLDVLREGIQYRLPTLSWTVTYGGVLLAEARKEDTARADFQAWAEHLRMQPEDRSQDGRTVLRGVTEDGVPGRGRRVRIILIAKFYEPAQPVPVAG